MAGLNFLDANVWMALIWDRHTHSGVARQWFEQASEGEFFYCSFAQVAVLRLLTTESVMGRDTQTMAGAWSLWDRAVADAEWLPLLNPPDWKQNSAPLPIAQPFAQSLGRCLSPGLCVGRRPKAGYL